MIDKTQIQPAYINTQPKPTLDGFYIEKSYPPCSTQTIVVIWFIRVLLRKDALYFLWVERTYFIPTWPNAKKTHSNQLDYDNGYLQDIA